MSFFMIQLPCGAFGSKAGKQSMQESIKNKRLAYYLSKTYL